MKQWPKPIWSTSALDECHLAIARERNDSLQSILARTRITAAAGDLITARRFLTGLRGLLEGQTVKVDDLRQIIPVALLIHDRCAASHFFATALPAFHVEFAVTISPYSTAVSMHVKGRSLTFILSDSLFGNEHGETLLRRLVDVFPVLAAYLSSSLCMDGIVALNLGDRGAKPGLAFCDNRPGYFLIPDSSFLESRGYSSIRAYFAEHLLPWEKRSPVAFWRGVTTGQPLNPEQGLRSLPRVRLCQIGMSNRDLIDAGITKVLQTNDSDAISWFAQTGFLRPHVQPESFRHYKYQIDIDGNTTSWPGLFIKLLTASVVLKVPPRDALKQWYYDRLIAWVNFIPLKADMSDLPDIVRWLRENDLVARKIGEAGFRLASELTYEREIERSISLVANAMKSASRIRPFDRHLMIYRLRRTLRFEQFI